MTDAQTRRSAMILLFLDLIGFALLPSLSNANSPGSASQDGDISRWKTFRNRAGWRISYPPAWRVGSCAQCDDPTNPNVFVTLYDPSSKALVMIDHLIDKPAGQTVDDWMHDVARTTVLSPQVSEGWTSLGGIKALTVINRNPDSTERQNIYVVHGDKNFAIRTDRHDVLCQRILSTFRFATPK